jgi:replication factor A1
MSISDSANTIQAICNYIELAEYDLISIKKYHVQTTKKLDVIMLTDISVAFTKIPNLIGSPVEIKREEEAKIPASAVEARPMDDVEELPKVRPVRSLGILMGEWAIKVRVTRKKKIRTFTKANKEPSKLLPLELIDKDDTEISATIFGDTVEKYDGIVKEGKCYIISKGTIRTADARYTRIDNDYTIVLDEFSIIKPVEDDPLIKVKSYKYTPIEKINEIRNGKLVNVLGIVEKVGPVSSIVKPDGEIRKRTVTIYDESKTKINITMWRDFVDEKLTEGEIVGITDLRVTEYNNTKQLNSAAGTEVKESPKDNRVSVLELMKCQGVAPLQTKASYKENINLVAEITSMDEQMVLDNKGKYYYINAVIMSSSHKKNFFYIGCNNCKKKVEGGSCTNCSEDKGTKTIYNFTVQVTDGTGSMWINVFGDDGEKLLGKSAEEVKGIKETNEKNFKIVFDRIKGQVSILLNQ